MLADNRGGRADAGDPAASHGGTPSHLCYNTGHRVSDSAATSQLARTQKRLLMVPYQEQPSKTPDTGAAFPLPRVPNDTGNSLAWPGVAADSATMNNDPIITGQRSGWGSDSPFGIQPEDARHHTYIIGKTGSGKTTLLRNMILQHLWHGSGLALIDPHGDLAEELLDHYPPD